MEPLEVLFEAEGLPTYHLPPALAHLYGGGLGFPDPVLYTNFVTSLDGVVAVGGSTDSGSLISGRSQADRLVMGLLRACADAVLIGVGTLRATPRLAWTPELIYPDAAPSFAALRSGLGRPERPLLVVATASGRLDPGHPALAAGALVLTTQAVRAGLVDRVPPGCEVRAVASGPELPARAIVEALRDRGHRTILSEAGPTLTASLVGADLVDELFLTVSPLVAGRTRERHRPGFVDGVELLPGSRLWDRLLTVRRHGSYLFLRYALAGTRPAGP